MATQTGRQTDMGTKPMLPLFTTPTCPPTGKNIINLVRYVICVTYPFVESPESSQKVAMAPEYTAERKPQDRPPAYSEDPPATDYTEENRK